MGMLGDDAPFSERFARLLRAGGGDVTVTNAPNSVVRAARTGVLDGLALPLEAFDAWNGLWEGLAIMEGVRLLLTRRRDMGDTHDEWRVISR
jgi:hypothetical protein